MDAVLPVLEVTAPASSLFYYYFAAAVATMAGAVAVIMTDVALILAGLSFCCCYSAAVETTTGAAVDAAADANHLRLRLITHQRGSCLRAVPFYFCNLIQLFAYSNNKDIGLSTVTTPTFGKDII